MPRTLLVALVLLAVGCTPDATDDGAPIPGEVDVQSNETTEAAEPAPVADVDTTGPAQIEVAGQSVPARAVVTDMESGDRACYLTLREDGGASTTVFADYSVCDSNAILDRRVQIEYAPDDIIAASCEGDPECLDTETVAMAVVVTPIDG